MVQPEKFWLRPDNTNPVNKSCFTKYISFVEISNAGVVQPGNDAGLKTWWHESRVLWVQNHRWDDDNPASGADYYILFGKKTKNY